MQGSTRTIGFVVGAVAGGLALTAVGTATNKSPTPRAAARHAHSRIAPSVNPGLAFEPNARRVDGRVRYLAQGRGYSVFLTNKGATLALGRGDVVRTSVERARTGRPSAEGRLPGVVNDYRDGHSITGLRTYGRVRYAAVYPGIDLIYHGREGALEYDFDVAPGADPSQIALKLSGQRRLSLAPNGDLLVRVAHGTLRQGRPVAFQQIGSHRAPVDAAYEISQGRVRFRLGDYDHHRPLVIDPVLSYASYLGGSGNDYPERVALAPNGSVLVTGGTTSNDFPGATLRTAGRTDSDAFVTSHDSSGTRMWTTYVGGTNQDAAHDLAVDSSGRVYVVGETTSTGIEVTPTNLPALDTCADATTDAFLARLFADGTMSYLSCFGGNSSDIARGIALRDTANGGAVAYVAGSTTSTDFTTPSGAKAPFQTTNAGGMDAFLAEVTFGGNACLVGAGPCATLPYRTYLGGTGDDFASDAALYSNLGAYMTGTTTSTNFPVTVGGDASPGFADAFVGQFDTSSTNPGTNRVYSRYFGGTNGNTTASAINVNAGGDAFIVGDSAATDLAFPATPKSTGIDGFIGEVYAGGTACCSAYIGTAGTDRLYDLALQDNGAALVVGKTSGSIATQNPIPTQSCSDGNNRVLVAKFYAGANPKWIYASCIGGNLTASETRPFGIAASSAGANGDSWITGAGLSFPAVSAPQPTYAGGTADGFLAHLVQPPPTIGAGPSGVIASKSAQFTFTSSEADMAFECSTPDVGHRLSSGTRATASCDLSGDSATYSNLAEGPHTFGVATVDDVNAKSNPATRTFTVDTLAPASFDLSSPSEGESTGTTPTFSWSAASDGTALTYQVFVDGQKLQDASGSACSAGSCSAQAPSAIATGPHSWKVVAVDAVGHSTDSASTRGFKVVLPPVAHLTVSPNPALVGATVTFDASASADATHTIARYEWDLDGDGSFERDTGATASTTSSYPAAQTVKVAVRVTDTGGSTDQTTADLKISAAGSAPGTVGVSINNGAQYTNKPDVTLTIVAPAGTTGLLISNDGGFATALPQAVSRQVAWRLDSSGPERLPKTVYLRFLTGTFGSSNYTDDIILDERPPVVDTAAVLGGASTASAAKLRTFKVKVKAHDTNSGVGKVQVAVKKKKPGKLVAYRKTVKVKLGARPKLIRARDKAGNFSKWKKLR